MMLSNAYFNGDALGFQPQTHKLKLPSSSTVVLKKKNCSIAFKMSAEKKITQNQQLTIVLVGSLTGRS